MARHYTVVYEPLQDDSGQVTNVIVVIYDITEPKLAAMRLAKSEARERERRQELETLLAAIPAAVFIAADKACTRITANRAGYELMRFRRVEMSPNPPPNAKDPNILKFIR